MSTSDLLPKKTTINIKGKQYPCKPMKMSHRIIVAKLQPFFQQFENIANNKKVELGAEELLSLENDMDILIKDLVPGVKDIAQDMVLDTEDIADILNQLLDTAMPEDVKKLRDANVKIDQDEESLKVPRT